MANKLLIDTNSLITPYKRFYPFDLAPGFWDSMRKRIEDGSIIILDKVYDELTYVDDDLSKWISDIDNLNPLSHRNPEVIKKYGEVLSHVQISGFYKIKALAEWSDAKVADPWLIAVASVYKYKIITFENPNGNLSKSAPSAHPKIPDVGKVFDVECKTLFDVMRDLTFSKIL